MEKKLLGLVEKIDKEGILLPNKIGKIEKGTSVKNLINKNGNDEAKKREIIAAFHR